MRPEILAILRCPEDRSPLRVATGDIVEEMNAAVRSGRLRNRAGRPIEHAIEAGLVRERGDLFYPIIEGIPVLLVDEAIMLDSAAGEGTAR